MFIPVPSRLVLHEMEKMAVHPVGIQIMAPKAELCPVKLFQVKSPAANIIKQEMLSMGCECVTVKGAINCSVPVGDVLLLGNKNQYRHLVEKLETMRAWFGFAEVIADLKAYLDETPLVTTLADGRQLTYEKMRVMGILNVTPDSFYAGSRVIQEETLLHTAGKMLEDGADILDIGGESTRPGAETVPPEEEIRRVTTALGQLRKAYPGAILSVDTYHAPTAKAALEAGADMINDVTAGTGAPAMVEVAAAATAPLTLMHMRGTPKTMVRQSNKVYENITSDVTQYLLERAKVCAEAGLGRDKVILDSGLGFAKNPPQSLEVCNSLEELTGHGLPVLVAASRKGFIGKALGDLPAEERLEGTLAVTAAAVYAGTNLVRVHDVKENVRLIRMLEAIRACQ